ncbi:10790_t:CDS:2 [Cetraspora pellucida]|uniref:10790_t:CDS:1 n=1 Tax=Cetraspora pellucida TaxID=1433469 RepID=A0ACA9ME11_9GLOM|nr:10790_t:CDS:2 [Cetraspora pellucida]
MVAGVGDCLYTSSLFILTFLTIIALGISAYDIIYNAKTRGYYPYVYIASGSYFLTGFVTVLLGWCRLNHVKKALANIPKPYMPIKQNDLPNSVFNLITDELKHVSMIAWTSEPKPEDVDLPGWGRPGSDYDEIHFKSSMIDTFSLIEQNALKNLSLKRLPSMSVQRYIDFLIEHRAIDRGLGHAYVECYERARFSEDEISQEQYTEFMKLVLQLLRRLGYNGD